MPTFYATVQDGLCELAADYLERTGFQVLGKIRGKIHFSCGDEAFKFLLRLKYVERLFVCLLFRLTQESSRAESSPSDSLLSALCDGLPSALAVWDSLQEGDDAASTGDGEPPAKSLRTAPPLRFRVDVRVRGSAKGSSLTQGLSASLAAALLRQRPSWVAVEGAASGSQEGAEESPSLILSAHVSDDGLFLGVPVTRRPLSLRPYLRHTLLRGPVCDVMAEVLLGLCPSPSTVLDPCAGSGALAAELRARSSALGLLCGDADEAMLAKLRDNDAALGEHFGRGWDGVLRWDARRLPLAGGSVDAVLSDLPFGQHFAREEDVPELYCQALGEVWRVLKATGLAVLMTSQRHAASLREAAERVGFAVLTEYRSFALPIQLSLGNTKASIFAFRKSDSV